MPETCLGLERRRFPSWECVPPENTFQPCEGSRNTAREEAKSSPKPFEGGKQSQGKYSDLN